MTTTGHNILYMKKQLFTLIILVFTLGISNGQMEVDGVTLYGNEWIDYQKQYHKIKIAEDGMYKVTIPELRSAGLPVDVTPMTMLQLHSFGNDYPMYTSTDGIGGDSDFILFYGEKHRSQLDKFLYLDESNIFNPEYSLINEEAAYFISVADAPVAKLELIETNLTGNTLQPQPFYMHTAEQVYTDWFYKPVINSGNIQFSYPVGSEGFGTARETITNNTSSKFYTKTEQLTYGVNTANLGETLTIKIDSRGSNDDKHRVGVTALTYPKTFDFDGSKDHQVNLPGANGPRYVEISGYESSESVYLYDATANSIYKTVVKNGKHGVILPASETVSKMHLYSSSLEKQAIVGSEMSFVDYENMDHDYILLTHKSFMDDGMGNNYVQEYADYRASDLGGNYNPIVVDIQDLYEQFAYGVDRHYIAIRNFNHFVKEKWPSIRFLFMVGHSLEYKLYRKEQQIADNNDLFYVPTFGSPGSDVLLMSTKGTNTPIFAYGRIAARNTDELKGYLDKVKAFSAAKLLPQTIENKLWQKEVLHLSGGTTNIQDRIARHLSTMEDTIENNMYGANVSTFYKKSSSSVQIALSDQIFDRISNGTSIVTFFGHSSVGTFDFSLDEVENYDNQDKYPILLSLGCYSGNIHTTESKSVSKEFVLTPNKGSIAFLASTGAAYINEQYDYARDFYDLLGNEFYGKPIGEAIINVIASTDGSNSNNRITFLQQLALHGDPALVMQEAEGPDVLCNENNTKISPAQVDTYQDEFTFCFDVTNLGKALDTDLEIQIQHLNPRGEVETDSLLRVQLPSYSDEVCVVIPIKNRDLLGENTIKVNLDPDDKIEEFPSSEAEQNNSLITNGEEGYKFFILSNSANPLFPREYAIVNEQKVNLVASTYNAFDEPQLFHIQIDTTEFFDSPFLMNFNVDNAQGTFSKEVNLPLGAETVYYWRVSQDSTANEELGAAWNMSSFVYVPDVGKGWNQSHFFQLEDGELENMEFVDKSLKYVNNVKDIRFEILADGSRTGFFINEAPWDGWHPTSGDIGSAYGAAVVVLDPIKGETWVQDESEAGIYGSEPTKRFTTYFAFKGETDESKAALVNFLTNVVPDGYSVVISLRNSNNTEYNLSDWYSEIDEQGSFFNTLVNEGARELEELNSIGTVPYLIAFVKGDDERLITETYSLSEVDGVNTAFQITVLWDRGNLTSPKIGPSQNWQKLEWDVSYSENSQNDTVSIDIIGIDLMGSETELETNIKDFSKDISSIDAQQYPYIKLRYNSKDEIDFSTAQLSKLRILYTGMPDVALIPVGELKETYEQGEEVSVVVKLINLSEEDLGPFDVTYNVIDDNNNETKSVKNILTSLKSGEEMEEVFKIGTKDKSGEVNLQIIANESRNPTEEYYINNLALTKFTTSPDKISPVLDVTFDGINILENDIVSANPLINVTLKDNNQFLLLDDTQSFTLLLEYPGGDVRQVDNDSPAVIFIPATDGSNNKARLEYNPQLEEDGTYKLTVNARDASENIAGNSSYTVSFRVFNEEMVSNVFNYPNPFSTSTQFVFTLTGNEEPGNLLIRIMTVTGKVVKEITMAELGNVKVGINKTDYKWDGTDEYGDKLANGVYFYQVITKKIDGSDYTRFTDPTQNNTDYLFKEGFGKLVIMR